MTPTASPKVLCKRASACSPASAGAAAEPTAWCSAPPCKRTRLTEPDSGGAAAAEATGCGPVDFNPFYLEGVSPVHTQQPHDSWTPTPCRAHSLSPLDSQDPSSLCFKSSSCVTAPQGANSELLGGSGGTTQLDCTGAASQQSKATLCPCGSLPVRMSISEGERILMCPNMEVSLFEQRRTSLPLPSCTQAEDVPQPRWVRRKG